MATISSRTKAEPAYAPSAAFDESRDARAIDHGDFLDRSPSDAPVLVGEVAAEIACTAVQIALRHRLRETARSSGGKHEAALRAARVIARQLGIPWSEIMLESAA